MSVLATALLLAQGCATHSGIGHGDEQAAREELISEPLIKDIPPKELALSTSRSGPAMRAELSARASTGTALGALPDVLFDFDQASLRMDGLSTLERNAVQLQREGVSRLLLEGRGDEVGTAAYNLVLGDRRAKNVKAYLQQLGLSVDVRTTSYGKDRPLCFEHHSECLQRNRSVHFVVKE